MVNRKERPETVQGNRGKGRPKGAKNKLTRDVRGMILGALDQAGGEAYLLEQARENPTAFMTLLGKVLPKEMEVTGKDGGPVQSVSLSVSEEKFAEIAAKVAGEV